MHKLLDLFKGKYTLQRTTHLGQIFSGTAEFSSIRLTERKYVEHGTYILSGQVQDFYQIRYFSLKENMLLIKKQDQSILHEFQLPNKVVFPLILKHLHQCKSDEYEINLMLKSNIEFETHYTIYGPKKNEIIHSVYVRNN